MKRASLMAAMAMASLVAGVATVSGPMALEAQPDPDLPKRKRSTLHPPPPYRAPRGRLPHIGAKERARHAGMPDGLMHGLPYLHRSEAAK